MSLPSHATDAFIIATPTKILITITSLLMSAYAFYEMRIRTTNLDEDIKTAVDSLRYPENPNILIHKTYTGVDSIDYGLRFLVTAFLPGVTGFHDPAAMVLSAYFLMSFLTLLAIYFIEAGKSGAKGHAIRFTSLWASFYQTVGGAVVIPILHLFLVRQYWKAEYYSLSNKISPPYARALLPALVLGYLLPTIALYVPLPDATLELRQKLIAFWQITPFVVSILLMVFETLFANFGEGSKQSAKSVQSNTDIVYIVCFLVSTFTHVGTIFVWKAWNLSFVQIFVPQAHYLEHGIADPLHHVFQIDCIIILASGLLMAFLVLWFQNSSGKIPFSAVQIMLALGLGAVIVGPAATIAAAYLVRDTPFGRVRSGKKIN